MLDQISPNYHIDPHYKMNTSFAQFLRAYGEKAASKFKTERHSDNEI